MFARSLHVTTPLNEFVCTIIDREPIFHWGRTHRSGERFSRRKSGQFVALPLVDGLHYRYDGRLKEPNPSCYVPASRTLAICVRAISSASAYISSQTQAPPHAS